MDKNDAINVAKEKLATIAKGKQTAETKRVVNSHYDCVNSVTVNTKGVSKVWSDNALRDITVYDVKKIRHGEIIAFGRSLVRQLTTTDITAVTADTCLVLAVSLVKPNSPLRESLLNNIPEDIGRKIPFTMPNPASPASRIEVAAATVQRLKQQMEKTDQSARNALASALETSEKRLNDLTIGKSTEGEEAASETSHHEAQAYCYLAACLLKLYGKTEESFLTAWQSYKDRYASWHDDRSEMLSSLSITAEKLKTLRSVLGRRPDICSTWILWVAYNENENTTLLKTERGLLQYLACQMFSYTGMHAYNLMVQIHMTSQISIGRLLRELDCPATRTSVLAMRDIVRDFEVTGVNPNRKTYFRYARVWDSGFFDRLQTSNCKMLTYVTAKTCKMLSNQGEAANPTNIYAIKDLDSAMTEKLDTVANNLFNLIMRETTKDEESGSVWY